MRTHRWIFEGLVTVGLLASSAGSGASTAGRLVALGDAPGGELRAVVEYDAAGEDLDRCGPPDNRLALWWDRAEPDHREKFTLLQAALVARAPVVVEISAYPEDCRGSYNHLDGLTVLAWPEPWPRRLLRPRWEALP
jgi:hypothetical protein